jgi:hypothetical protein
MITSYSENLIRGVIESTRHTITGGKSPEGNCTHWNQDLAIALRMNEISAIPYGSSTYAIPSRYGGKTIGHAITIAEIQNQWIAIDLTSEQVQNLPSEKIWVADSLKELCDQVDLDLPNFMTYRDGDENSMLQAARRSKDKDLSEGRYFKFTQSHSGEAKG